MGAISFLYSTSPPPSLSTFKSSSHSKNTLPVSIRTAKPLPISLGHFSKHLKYRSPIIPKTAKPTSTHLIAPLKCSYSNSSPLSTQTPETKSLKLPFFPFLNLSHVTPLEVCKWAGIISVAIAATKKTISILLSPFFWMYFSWTWLFWPWLFAIALAIYGVYCLRKHWQQKASIAEQLVVLTSAITWLTLVPAAHFNGYLEGWPIGFFFAYHYFFFFDASIRKRLYGDLYPRSHDPRWDVRLPILLQLAFSCAIMVGHCLAAWEGPALHLTPGRWANVGIWVLIAAAQFMKYHSSLYLAKYSEKVVVPTSVVQFGPYRWVRHPIYASTILLFAAYCAALRAPFSLLFIVAVCLAYYDQKARVEEDLMVKTFGQTYSAYMSKVQHKFIPLVY